MRKIMITLFAVGALAASLPMAAAQDGQRRSSPEYGNRDREPDRDRADRGDGATRGDVATATDLVAADRRLNQIYARRVADARQDDRADRRYRGWYSQEAALRDSERVWINFRDAECRYLTQPDAGNRNAAGRLRACLLDQTNKRTFALRSADTMLSSR